MPFDNSQQVQYQPQNNGVSEALANALRMYGSMNAQNPKTPDAMPTAADTNNMMNGTSPSWNSSMPQQPAMQPVNPSYSAFNNMGTTQRY
jgi:hypothetical protein